VLRLGATHHRFFGEEHALNWKALISAAVVAGMLATASTALATTHKIHHTTHTTKAPKGKVTPPKGGYG